MVYPSSWIRPQSVQAETVLLRLGNRFGMDNSLVAMASEGKERPVDSWEKKGLSHVFLSIRTILLKLKLFQFLRILHFFYHEIKLTKLASTLNSTGLAGGSNTVEFKLSSKRVLSSVVSERGTAPVNRLACLDSDVVLLLRYAGLARSVLPLLAVVTLQAFLASTNGKRAENAKVHRERNWVLEIRLRSW